MSDETRPGKIVPADGSAPIWRKSSRCQDMTNCVEVAWRTSSYSAGGNCVQVATSSSVMVRDSKDPSSPVIVFDRDAWQQFVRWIG